MFDVLGINEWELLVLVVVAVIVIGPQRLPKYIAQAGQLLRKVRVWAGQAKDRVQDELGEDVDWSAMDPRQYDPRQIIRQALTDSEPSAGAMDRPDAGGHGGVPMGVRGGPGGGGFAPEVFDARRRTPFDDEAT